MKQKVLLGVLSILLVGLGTIGIHYSLTVNAQRKNETHPEFVTEEVNEKKENNSLENDKIEQENKEEDSEENNIFIKNATIEDVKKAETKKNLYLFYGDGCPYCERELAFLEQIYPEYQSYFNLYAFEVWNNQENKEFLNQVAELLDTKAGSVPYLVIGNEVIIGFNEERQTIIQDKILENTNFDILEEIKKQEIGE